MADRSANVARVARTSFVLAVPDLARSVAHWCDVLGFSAQARFEGWCFVGRDGCRIMLGECPEAIPPGELGDHAYFGYIELDDLDRYHEEIAARGATILAPPADRPWGMREMPVRTVDGHRVMFAQTLPATKR
jgi:catechol 2,3-dioxygenase-like lactoylglutathione lyase family enzyme